MIKAAQEVSSEEYLLYVEDGNSRRTRLIGKKTISELETNDKGRARGLCLCRLMVYSVN
jgi:hypothetical protein